MMVVFGTRPEAIKLAPVINDIKMRGRSRDLVVCSTGQHKEMLEQTMAVFGICPDINLSIMQDMQTLPELTSRLMLALSNAFAEQKPDAVIVQGDTTTAFIAALAAFYLKIPVAHVEAGLRTGHPYSPFPEEMNRTMISRIATWNFAPTQKASDNLTRERVNERSIHLVGNTIVDAIEMLRIRGCLTAGAILENLKPFVSGKTILITSHRRENLGSGLIQICEAIRLLAARYPDMDFVFPVHMNPQVRTTVFTSLANIDNVHLLPPVDFMTSLYLQSLSCLILTDSGGIQEEAPSFGVPVLVMREFTERSEGVDEGFSVLVGTETENIVHTAERFLRNPEIENKLSERPNPYGDGLASKRIVGALFGERVESFRENG